MTIKEIEALCGMTRANIRFYEAEGLLAPARGQNGYRDYSYADAETLKRIKLLRTLRVPLEDIKALSSGEEELTVTLKRHLLALEQEQLQLDRSQRVCREICDDRADYRTLDAQRYLDSLSRTVTAAADVPAADIIPPVRSPWRRLFARGFDMALYSTLWYVFLLLVCNVKVSARSAPGNVLDSLVMVLIMLFLEPLLLKLFAATPGKWLMGLRVTDNFDGRLTYRAALSRTWLVLCRGLGLYLPVYHLVRLYKSYKECMADETPEWEYDSTLWLRDEKPRRAWALAGAYAVLIAVLGLSLAGAEMPRHRGDITAQQFCENFRRLAAYHNMEFDEELGDDGKWREKPVVNLTGAQEFKFYIGGDVQLPDFVFTLEGGVLREVKFCYETTESEIYPPSCCNQMILSALAFACAQPEYGMLSASPGKMVQMISQNAFKSFSFEKDGVAVRCTVEYSGYEGEGTTMLRPAPGEQQHYVLKFCISLI